MLCARARAVPQAMHVQHVRMAKLRSCLRRNEPFWIWKIGKVQMIAGIHWVSWRLFALVKFVEFLRFCCIQQMAPQKCALFKRFMGMVGEPRTVWCLGLIMLIRMLWTNHLLVGGVMWLKLTSHSLRSELISFHYSIACSKVQRELPLRADKNTEWLNKLKLVKMTQRMCVECWCCVVVIEA